MFAYDAADRLTPVTPPRAPAVAKSFDANGSQMARGAESYSYDAANRLTSVLHRKGATTLASASYTLDADGNRLSKTTPAGTESYVLDALNRLTSATPPGATATTYSYDAAGNRLTLANAGGTTGYTYDAADRLTSVTPPGAAALANSFDANGSQTARGADSFSWDAANRLASATVGGQAASFSYNGENLRMSRTVAGTTTNFVWDIGGGLPVLLDDGTQYIYGAGLVSHLTASGTVYYLADGLGSTMAMVDSTGSVVQTYDYDAFGGVRSSSGTQSTEFQFAGEQTDPSGLQYLRARYYDPTTGRFLSRDGLSLLNPAAFHPYTFGRNNPVLNRDPSGRCDEDDVETCLDQGLGGGGVEPIEPVSSGKDPLPDVVDEESATLARLNGDTINDSTPPGSSESGGRVAGNNGGTVPNVPPGSNESADIAAVTVSQEAYPQAAAHIADAQAAGQPSILTVDRSGADTNRATAVRGIPTASGLDRDEYPPAMFAEGGQGASVRYINPADNRGAGASIGAQCSEIPNGASV